MKYTIELLGREFEVDFDAKVTCAGAPETGPTYSCGGQPAEPMEYEVSDIELFDADKKLELPAWLHDLIETELMESDRVYEAVNEAHLSRDDDDYWPSRDDP